MMRSHVERQRREVERARVTPAQHMETVAMLDAADRRARDLLMSCLTEEQRRAYERDKAFLVVSNLGHIFKITQKRIHGVFKLNAEGLEIEEWCVTPNGPIPVCDVMLAQKLALETDEGALRAEANVWELPSRRMVYSARHQWHAGQADYLREAVA